MTKMTGRDERLIELYKVAVEEEHRGLESHQARVSFLAGFISAILAATVAGVIQGSEWFHYLFLMLGPALIISLSLLGFRVSSEFYVRFLSAISMRAKIEDELGLTARRLRRRSTWIWPEEAIVPTRHLTSRKHYSESSQAWVDGHRITGYNRSARMLFGGAIVLGSVLLFALIWLTIATYDPSTAPPERFASPFP